MAKRMSVGARLQGSQPASAQTGSFLFLLPVGPNVAGRGESGQLSRCLPVYSLARFCSLSSLAHLFGSLSREEVELSSEEAIA